MELWHKILLSVMAVAMLATSAFVAGYTAGERRGGTARPAGAGFETIRHAYEQILLNSENPPPERELVDAAIRGMIRTVRSHDPHAVFYRGDEYQALEELTTGRFSGIGVWLRQRRGRLHIVSALPGSPARRAGLRRGDVIEEVDGDDVSSRGERWAIERIKGPPGSEVTVTVDRRGRPYQVTVTREQMQIPNLTARAISDDVGYVRLLGFARSAGRQLRQRVESLVDRGVAGLVLDLRDNGGGLLSEAVDVAGAFVEEGDVVTLTAGGERRVYEAEGDAFEDIPLVVLVNQGSASAAEIVAGALKDHGRATLVGTQTHGKGSIQQLFRLVDDSAVKLTTGRYLTPDGTDIDGRGIAPHVEAKGSDRSQRRRAVEMLREVVAERRG